MWSDYFYMKDSLSWTPVRRARTLSDGDDITRTSLHTVFGKEAWDLVSVFLKGTVEFI